MSNIDKHSELRKELSNPAIGSNAHLRKLALALLDELEAKDKAWSAQDNHINQQADRIESLEKKNGELGRALGAEGKRIAELEAKKVKIKMPESFYPDGDIECPLVINEYQIIEAILAAGCMPTAVCPRCKSELDLSHKHDGAHYCHAAGPGKGD